MFRTALVLPLAIMAAGCHAWMHGDRPSGSEHETHHAAHHGEPVVPRRTVPEGAGAPLFNDLGDFHYAITTDSELAQKYFDQGFILAYAFNHAEAARSFAEARRQDPECAMCAWGEAYVLGPNINKPMDPLDTERAFLAIEAARELSAGASDKERALIGAMAHRYAPEAPEDRSDLDRAYAEAMRQVAEAYPDDLDIQALWVESVMDTMPWDYYDEAGREKPETAEILARLESVLARDPSHAGAIHFYIHLVEPSESAVRAESAADRLRTLVPGAGHLVHMPAHIYLRIGRYEDATIANEKAAEADESYITQCRAQGFYPAAYYPHNVHFLWAAASFEGRSALAIPTAEKLVGLVPQDAVAETPLLEEFLPTHLVALARFGRWDELAEQPKPPEPLVYLTGMWHYTQGLASLGVGDAEAARVHLGSLRSQIEAPELEGIVYLSGSTPTQLLTLAASVLEGRIIGAEGRWDEAIPRFEEAVRIQDDLPYTEPPPWYFPTRELLGHALLESGEPDTAEIVFREQLEETPRNGWSLFGLAKSLRAQGRTGSAASVETRFREAWARADVELTSSVF